MSRENPRRQYIVDPEVPVPENTKGPAFSHESKTLDARVAGNPHNVLLTKASGKEKYQRKILEATNYALIVQPVPFFLVGILLIIGATDFIADDLANNNPDADPGELFEEETRVSFMLIAAVFVFAGLVHIFLNWLLLRKPDYSEYNEKALEEELLKDTKTKPLAEPTSDAATKLWAGDTYDGWLAHLLGEVELEALIELLLFLIGRFSSSPKYAVSRVEIPAEPAAAIQPLPEVGAAGVAASVVAPPPPVVEMVGAAPAPAAAPAAAEFGIPRGAVAMRRAAIQAQAAAAGGEGLREFCARHGIDPLTLGADG
ncbi:MAG: hypothetical protein K0U29_02415, partial [Gammaproteobacteria bacterium]|nr:hypothetical protein [Gammaproteobacteria bacterium]